MKFLFSILFILNTIGIVAQNNDYKFDFRLGSGFSLLGSGDMTTTMIENELNYSVNHYITTAVSAGFGYSDKGVYLTAAFMQGNLNIYVSPFRNNRKFDFRIGTGLSYYRVTDGYIESYQYQNGNLIDKDYIIRQRNSFGPNIIIENSYSFTKKFIIGLKLFSQPYQNGDINTGILLKLGYRID